ncbi:type II and III secretion system protein family protein [Futiania mangrovi]|uniref:Type II and III secretion system protein family protein n=1 Tax=Futiania mangrovi TaxID=2959716 RepID=A0A9J6PK01_9PROT|nr:type II and III secretion system protein family protein [Futiania mangrovii]MCP1336871.1 type II and III secretion system protein family protein [Futiania mangrovii]
MKTVKMSLMRTPFAACALAAGILGAGLAAAVAPAQAAGKAPFNVSIQQGDTATTRRITLPLNKAAIVNLPVDARDVLVANPTKVDAVVRTSRQVYLMGVEVGSTNAFFFDAAGNQILNLEIEVERDLTALEEMLKRQFPTARIKVEALNDNLIITGTAPSAMISRNIRDIAARFMGDENRILNAMTILGQEQVMLKIKVAEMSRSIGKALGIDWESAFQIGSFSGAIDLLNGFTSTTSNGQISGGYNRGDLSIDSVVRALETQGLVRTLAEPTLVAVSGESARFLAGGEFPIPVSRDDEGITIEFREFGVALAFTPVVLSEGRISLKISAEVSDITPEGAIITNAIAIPGLSVRRTDTTIELPSGGSFAIAGLLSQDTRHGMQSLPGVQDVPILGALMRSNDFASSESELVILATPYLVEPTHESEIRLPTDGFAPASNYDAFLMGRLHAVYGSEGAPLPAAKVKGPVGFITE